MQTGEQPQNMRCGVIGRSFPSQAQAFGAEPGADEESVHHDAVEWRPDFGDQRELFGQEQQGACASHFEAEDIHCDTTSPPFVHEHARNTLLLGDL